MDASCDCSCTDYDDNRCWTDTIRKARKQHDCCECDDPIKPGQRYRDMTGIDAEGEPFHYRMCLPCYGVQRTYCPHGWLIGELANHVRDCFGYDYRDPIPEDAFEDIDEEDASRIAAAKLA